MDIMNFVFWYLIFANSLLSSGYTYNPSTNQFTDAQGKPYVGQAQHNPFNPPRTVIIRGQTRRLVTR